MRFGDGDAMQSTEIIIFDDYNLRCAQKIVLELGGGETKWFLVCKETWVLRRWKSEKKKKFTLSNKLIKTELSP